MLLHPAGFTWDGMIHKITSKQWDAMLAVHCTAPFRLIQVPTYYPLLHTWQWFSAITACLRGVQPGLVKSCRHDDSIHTGSCACDEGRC